jgi:flagellar biosynthesis protein FlhF
MHVHRVVGGSLREALQRARRLHGEDAVVVGQELAKSGSVTLTVARRAKRGPSPLTTSPSGTREETRTGATDPGLRELATRLRKNGASPAFVERVLADVTTRRADLMAQRQTDVHVLDVAADALGAMFTTVKLPRARGRARVLALAGAAGVGKTTTIAKLALRLVRAGRRVELVTFDADRPGAVEYLRAWAGVLGTPFRIAKSGAEIDARMLSATDLVLVDTSGRPERDITRLSRMRDACQAAGAELDTYVALSAGASASTLRAITATLARLEPTAAVVTKLDETTEPIGVLEHVIEANLPVAFLCDGPDVNGGWHRAQATHFGDLCLLGRVA